MSEPGELTDQVSERAYCVTCVNGPANGASYITFIPPGDVILMAPIRARPGRDVEWARMVESEEPWEGQVQYRREALPTEPDDMNITVDGDWFVPYTVVE